MKKYLNIFWAILSLIVILTEFIIGSIHFNSFDIINLGAWVFVALWLSIAAQNIYSFYIKQFVLNQK